MLGGPSINEKSSTGWHGSFALSLKRAKGTSKSAKGLSPPSNSASLDSPVTASPDLDKCFTR